MLKDRRLRKFQARKSLMWLRKSTDLTSLRIESCVACEIIRLDMGVKTADDDLRTWWLTLSFYLHKTEAGWRKSLSNWDDLESYIRKVNIWSGLCLRSTATSGLKLIRVQVEPICIWIELEQWWDWRELEWWRLVKSSLCDFSISFAMVEIKCASWCLSAFIKILALVPRSAWFSWFPLNWKEMRV